MSNRRRLRQAPELPYDTAARLVGQLVDAARLDDDGQRLGVLAGTASLDPRLAGTVIGMLAFAVVAATDMSAEELLARLDDQ